MEKNGILTSEFSKKWGDQYHNRWNTIRLPALMGFQQCSIKCFGRILRMIWCSFVSPATNVSFLFKLNFRVITLLPQKYNAVQIQNYRSICLHNASLYFFAKVATNHSTKTASNVIIRTQSAFMPSRVLEGVVVLHETIHELHQKNGWCFI
jgi:hypothetical protein